MLAHTATYSPEDDKIRIYPAYRLPADEYQELKSAGYSWAPKQECFYAVWTPHREKTAIDFCGEIGDEDTSLIDRAEDRADRFTNYSEKRADDAERAHQAVKAIADNIPFGQPILVGHHSERHARKDAERIENGMRKAVKMWDTSEYWTRRAAGAVAHAKYKELPAVRARRIKGLESDKRKREKAQKEAQAALDMWNKPGLTLEQGRMLACYSPCRLSVVKRDDGLYWSAYDVLQDDDNRYKACPARTLAEVVEAANQAYPRTIAHNQKWLDHIENRLTYEKAMLAEGGGLVADKFDIAIGGRVRSKWGWHVVIKINKKSGVMTSVSVADLSWTLKTEDIKDYEPPAEGDGEKVKTATKLAPLCNYETPDCARMTQAEYTATYKDHKGSETIAASDSHGRHRIRTVSSFIARRHGSATKDQWGYTPVFITDAKVKEAPKPEASQTPRELPAVPRELPQQREYVKPEPTKADELRQQLKAGVQVVAAPQLFPTPAPLAARMVELADIEPGMCVLEPSAGTGRIIQALRDNFTETGTGYALTAVEINGSLADILETGMSVDDIHRADFLTWESATSFDRVLMNPPFTVGADIKHIKHAYELLKPGGKLVAICANGPRQTDQLKPLADYWEPLPAGTFEESGTSVSTVLLSISKPA